MRLLICLAFCFSLTGLELRPVAKNMKTSVIIPCHADHFPLLEHLLNCYAMQSVVPDEVVISLSEHQRISSLALDALAQHPWPFALKLLRHTQKYTPGKNRNEACTHASGDLLICQDADDLPHPQRVEIIRHLFANYNLEHLLHQWLPTGASLVGHLAEQAALACRTFRIYEQIDVLNVHNGSVSFLRTLFDKLHWMPLTGIHEDVLFNRSAYVFCAHKAVLQWPLLTYRFELSTFDLDGTKAQRAGYP